MVTIQDYVVEQLEELTSIELKDKMGVSLSMLSSYKKSYNPSLEVAKRIYAKDNVVLHPFAEQSLIFEINKGK